MLRLVFIGRITISFSKLTEHYCLFNLKYHSNTRYMAQQWHRRHTVTQVPLKTEVYHIVSEKSYFFNFPIILCTFFLIVSQDLWWMKPFLALLLVIATRHCCMPGVFQGDLKLSLNKSLSSSSSSLDHAFLFDFFLFFGGSSSSRSAMSSSTSIRISKKL